MKNVVQAITAYISTKNAFPPAGVFGEGTTNVLTSPANGAVMTWMPGGDGSGGLPMYSFVVPILPYLDQQNLADQWLKFNASTGAPLSFIDVSASSNGVVASTDIGVLRVPMTVPCSKARVTWSYVVNGGFATLPRKPGWMERGGKSVSGVNVWTTGTTTQATIAVTQKLGVMFLESTFTQNKGLKVPWNIHSTLSDVSDGGAPRFYWRRTRSSASGESRRMCRSRRALGE